MKAKIDSMEQLLAQAAGRYVSKEEAKAFANLYVETHLKKSPRMNPLQEAVNDIQAWQKVLEKNKDLKPDRIVDKPGIMLYDFNKLPPSLKIKEIQDQLENKARKNGIAAAGLMNSAGIITLSMWVDGLAKRDLIGIAMFNGGTECCVPHGAKKGVLGTNPLAYAIPTSAMPMMLDMATTQIPFFDINNAKENQVLLQENAALDQEGQPTRNAARALDDKGVANLLPLGGGFKGYGIMMLIEVLTGSLIRSLLSTEQCSGWNPTEYGCFMIAIDIGGFTDLNQFKINVGQMGDTIRALTPVRKDKKVSIPGDRGHAKVKEAQEKGEILIDTRVFEELKRLAGSKPCV